MTDKFEEFESNVYNWMSRHKLGLMLIGLIVVLWVILSMSVVSIFGIVGASTAENLINESYHAGNSTWTPESYSMWENYMMPIIVKMFDTMSYLMFVIAISYTSLVVYLSYKYVWRKRNDEYNS